MLVLTQTHPRKNIHTQNENKKNKKNKFNENPIFSLRKPIEGIPSGRKKKAIREWKTPK